MAKRRREIPLYIVFKLAVTCHSVWPGLRILKNVFTLEKKRTIILVFYLTGFCSCKMVRQALDSNIREGTSSNLDYVFD